MKSIIFCILLIFLSLGFLKSSAQDSLSNADAYNMEVNDVFEYKIITPYNAYNGLPAGKRITILSKSETDSTYTYQRKIESYTSEVKNNGQSDYYLSYTFKNSVDNIQFPNNPINIKYHFDLDSCYSFSDTLYKNSMNRKVYQYNYYLDRSNHPECPANYYSMEEAFTEGLGINYHYDYAITGEGEKNIEELTYYKKGNETWGKPDIAYSKAGVEQNKINNLVDIYPIPADQNIKLHFLSTPQLINKIILFDLLGNKIQEINQPDLINKTSISIHSENLKSGIYLIHYFSTENSGIKKISIVHD